jgi:hypothetical protein
VIDEQQGIIPLENEAEEEGEVDDKTKHVSEYFWDISLSYEMF